jgi:glycosyltransferase involved in cell wall biosynthesis
VTTIAPARTQSGMACNGAGRLEDSSPAHWLAGPGLDPVAVRQRHRAGAAPVLAVADGGPLELVEDGVTGLLRPPDPRLLAEALLDLSESPETRRRLARTALGAVAVRSW